MAWGRSTWRSQSPGSAGAGEETAAGAGRVPAHPGEARGCPDAVQRGSDSRTEVFWSSLNGEEGGNRLFLQERWGPSSGGSGQGGWAVRGTERGRNGERQGTVWAPSGSPDQKRRGVTAQVPSWDAGARLLHLKQTHKAPEGLAGRWHVLPPQGCPPLLSSHVGCLRSLFPEAVSVSLS